MPALSLAGRPRRADRALRPGRRSRRRDDRALPRARPRARPGHRRPRRLRSRRVRRLAPAARAVRHLAARGRARVRDRVRRATAFRSSPASAPRSSAPRSCSSTWPGSRELYLPAARVGTALPQPGARRDVPADPRRGARRLARGGDRAGAARVLRGVRRRGDRPLRRRGGRPPDRRTTSPRWRASLEPVASLEYRGLTVCKTLPWGAGPVGLQQLALLDGFDLAEPRPTRSSSTSSPSAPSSRSPTATRSTATHGAEMPLETLLSTRVQRRAAGARSARKPRPTTSPGSAACRPSSAPPSLPVPGEPTRGDTVHLDAVDRWGNMVSATPSGGWLHSSPVIPALGWPLGTRAQMFWLEEGLPSSLAPGRPPADDAQPGARAPRRRAVPGLGHARRRPAGAVGAARVPAARRPSGSTCRRRSTRPSSTPTT